MGVASGKRAEKPTTWVSEIENQAEDPEPEARAISKVEGNKNVNYNKQYVYELKQITGRNTYDMHQYHT